MMLWSIGPLMLDILAAAAVAAQPVGPLDGLVPTIVAAVTTLCHVD